MSSTNKTSNYELSQFIGTDKPAWLADYNADMSKIDTQMKANADGVTSASGSASSANTKIGTLASLTTEAKTDVVSAINEVDSHADSAQNTANSANSTAGEANLKATSANTAINALKSYLAFNNTGQSVLSLPSGVTRVTGVVRYALNTDGTAGKVYTNSLILRSTSTGIKSIGLGITVDAPATAYTINSGKGLVASSAGVYRDVSLTVDTSGNVAISLNFGANEDTEIYLPPCIYFFTDFGDQPE